MRKVGVGGFISLFALNNLNLYWNLIRCWLLNNTHHQVYMDFISIGMALVIEMMEFLRWTGGLWNGGHIVVTTFFIVFVFMFRFAFAFLRFQLISTYKITKQSKSKSIKAATQKFILIVQLFISNKLLSIA